MNTINDSTQAHPEPNYDNPKHVWFPIMEKSFSIEVKCWKYTADSEGWVWNVYAHIFEGHPLFGEPEKAMESLHLHGGCTLDEMKTIEPSRGIRYEFQRIRKVLTVGCDYAHYGDDHYQSCDPADGVPGSIRSDVAELAEQLFGLAVNSQPVASEPAAQVAQPAFEFNPVELAHPEVTVPPGVRGITVSVGGVTIKIELSA